MHDDQSPPLILQPRTRFGIAWAALVLATVAHAWVAWHAYDTSKDVGDPTKARADGNFGHMLIDFAGNWLSARMLVEGHGRELYDRAIQREVVTAAFPRSDEAPQAAEHDADNLLGWMIEVPLNANDPIHRAIGGPLYPPTHALLFAPLGMLTPRTAYRLTQFSVLVLAWVC